MQIDYTIATNKPYVEAVTSVVARTEAHGFRVQFVHDVARTITDKGFECVPCSIVEICNARYASQVLQRDILVGLMLPCPIMVYEREGEVSISTMRPTLIGGFFPEADLDEIAAEVEGIVFSIVDEAAA